MSYVTIREVAERAGVSATTVSQILHGKGRFSPKTRESVLGIVEKMGYIPDSRARAIRSGQAKAIGLLVPDLRNSYFADMVASMEEELYGRGYATLIGSFGEDLARQDSFLHNILGQRIDGAIVVPKGVDSPGMTAMVKRKLPLVFVDRRVPGTPSIPYIVSDPIQGIQQALDALISLGHRRIGFVSHTSLCSSTLQERETVFKTLASGLLEADAFPVVDCANDYESHSRGLDYLLRQGVTAIVFGYSPDAISMVGILQERNLLIGSDISVVSFDDIAAFRLMTPSISVISQQADEMGRRGVEEVLDLIGDTEGDTGRDSSANAKGAAQEDSPVSESGSAASRGDRMENHRMVRIPTVFIPRGSLHQVPSLTDRNSRCSILGTDTSILTSSPPDSSVQAG